MEIILLGIYSFFVWLIFFKFKWLPWNIVSQVITITLPIIAMTALILILNVVAPSSHDVRVVNYVVPINPAVRGLVTSVPVEPNRPVKKGDVLFTIDPTPFEINVKSLEAKVAELRTRVIAAASSEKELGEQLKASTSMREAAESRISGLQASLSDAQASERGIGEQLKTATAKVAAVQARMDLATRRVDQYRELLASGAGSLFDLQQAEAEVQNLTADIASARASESEVKERLSARSDTGEFAGVSQARAQLLQAQNDVVTARATEAQTRQKLANRDDKGIFVEVLKAQAQLAEGEAQLADAKWELTQTTMYAPANGTIIGLTLRPGAMAVPLPMSPAMNFVEDEQWVLAIFKQNEVREVKPGQEAEVAFEMYPGRIVKFRVDSVMWATAQGQLPIGSMNAAGGVAPIPANSLAVRLIAAEPDKDLFLAAGAHGAGAIYSESGQMIHIIRKIIVRVGSKLDWLVLKLH